MAGIQLRGTPGAPGIALGPVWRFAPARRPDEAHSAIVAGVDAPTADQREQAIRSASETAGRQLEELAERTRSLGREDEAAIFDAQALMATDPSIVDDAVARVQEGVSAQLAIREATDAAAAMLASLDDELLAARAADVRDVGARIERILTGEALSLPEVPSIAVADDLPPSVTAEIPPGFLLGIALAGGSRTAHAVILARSLDIPAIVGTDGLLGALDAAIEGQGATGHDGGAPVVAAIDGESGEVVLDPDPDAAAAFEAKAIARAARIRAAAALRDRPAATADGERVMVAANIGKPADAPRALEARAEGVGLFRTEFLFMDRRTPPTEAEQVDAYRKVLEAFGPDRPVVIRLADIGGDKDIPYLGLPPEANPFLGVRAIRLAYSSRDLLHTQLRAIWRAGAAAGVTPHVMAPMVATLEDVELLHSLRDRARESLVPEGLPAARSMVTGIMVEVPSAALMAAELARVVDFFSIGTNDLTQYLLAADRGNATLGRLQDALHPAVLRAIAQVVAGADAAGIPVAVCGELAGDPAGALVLVGLGVDELSADAASLDGIRAALAGSTRGQLDELAERALAATSADAVREMADARLAAGAASTTAVTEGSPQGAAGIPA